MAIFFISFGAFPKLSKNPTPPTEKSRFLYLEFFPNSNIVITLETDKCDPKTNDLNVQKFQSESKVTNGIVNVINVYAKSGYCQVSLNSKVLQQKIVLPKNGKSTHLYITLLSENLRVL